MQLTSPITDALERYMDLSTLELKLTAGNMANADTPGYRTEGFDFAAEMRRSMEALGQQGSAGAAAFAEPQVGPVGGLLERPDGNDVSMDREGMKMAEAQLQFRAGEALLKNQFTQTMDAIHEQ